MFWVAVSSGELYAFCAVIVLMVGSLLTLYYYMCIRFCWFVFCGGSFSLMTGGEGASMLRGIVGMLGFGILRFLLAGVVV